MPMPPARRQWRNAETGSRGSCLTRENRSSSAAATSRPSRRRQQADSWKKAERPRMFMGSGFYPPLRQRGRQDRQQSHQRQMMAGAALEDAVDRPEVEDGQQEEDDFGPPVPALSRRGGRMDQE